MKKLFINCFEKILTIRKIEEQLALKFKEKKNSSFLHLSIGQEGSATGVCLALDKKDIVFGNHRSHGHYIAKGGNISKLIFEVFGDKRGCCKGYGGSMHMLDRSVGFEGSTPILGSVPSIVAGMSMDLKNKNAIAVGFIGDGSAEEGTFYETVNLATVHRLPMLIVVEDNGYSVEVSRNQRKSVKYDLSKIINGIGALYSETDGQDVIKVYDCVTLIKKQILKKKKPAVLRLKLLRKSAHSGPESDIKSKYRRESHILHNKNDPIKILKIKLSKYLSKRKIDMIEIDILKSVEKQFYKTYKKIRF